MRKVCRSSRPTFLLPGAARVAWVRAEFSGEMNALFIVPFWLRLPCDLRYPLQDRFAGKDFYVLGEPPPPHDPLLISLARGTIIVLGSHTAASDIYFPVRFLIFAFIFLF